MMSERERAVCMANRTLLIVVFFRKDRLALTWKVQCDFVSVFISSAREDGPGHVETFVVQLENIFVVGEYIDERIEYQDMATVDRLLLWYSTKNGDRSDLVGRMVVKRGPS